MRQAHLQRSLMLTSAYCTCESSVVTSAASMSVATARCTTEVGDAAHCPGLKSLLSMQSLPEVGL